MKWMRSNELIKKAATTVIICWLKKSKYWLIVLSIRKQSDIIWAHHQRIEGPDNTWKTSTTCGAATTPCPRFISVIPLAGKTALCMHCQRGYLTQRTPPTEHCLSPLKPHIEGVLSQFEENGHRMTRSSKQFQSNLRFSSEATAWVVTSWHQIIIAIFPQMQT